MKKQTKEVLGLLSIMLIGMAMAFYFGWLFSEAIPEKRLAETCPQGDTCSPINQEICWSIDNGEYQMQGMTPNASLIYYAHCTPVKGSCFDYGVKWENGTQIPRCDEVDNG